MESPSKLCWDTSDRSSASRSSKRSFETRAQAELGNERFVVGKLHNPNSALPMKFSPDVLELCRRQFPALSRRVGDRLAAFFDGPGGTQVPQRVIDAVGHTWPTPTPITAASSPRRRKRPDARRGPPRPGRFSRGRRSANDRLRPEHDLAHVRPRRGRSPAPGSRATKSSSRGSITTPTSPPGCWPPAMPGRPSAGPASGARTARSTSTSSAA